MQTVLPRWRGFNLLDAFTLRSDGNFREEDFRWMAEWGFDFVRFPMCYLLWTEKGAAGEPQDVYKIKWSFLEKIDRGIEFGRRHRIHVCLNFHRGPGYSVNPEYTEPYNLWKDQEALDAFCFHWRLFAERYRGVPSQALSFNLINEPANATPDRMTRADHERVMRTAVAAIREIDPERLIILDGLSWGNLPCPELADLGVAQSCRAYAPMGISHYKARWVGGENWPEPTWPGQDVRGEYWDRARLEQHYQPWVELAAQGVGVHCGEGGAFNQTPRQAHLGWFRDVLEILTQHNIGYALWNLRGSFGILDSGRADVEYEDWHGHRLDRELLELLQSY